MAATAFSLTGTSAIAAGAIGGFIGGVAEYFEDDFKSDEIDKN